MMKQDDDAYGIPALSCLNSEQLIKHFARYGFRDTEGHPLENCHDFLSLIARVSQSGRQSLTLLESAAFKEAVKAVAIQAVAEQVNTRSGPVGRALK